jgi:hypothetical protein
MKQLSTRRHVLLLCLGPTGRPPLCIRFLRFNALALTVVSATPAVVAMSSVNASRMSGAHKTLNGSQTITCTCYGGRTKMFAANNDASATGYASNDWRSVMSTYTTRSPHDQSCWTWQPLMATSESHLQPLESRYGYIARYRLVYHRSLQEASYIRDSAVVGLSGAQPQRRAETGRHPGIVQRHRHDRLLMDAL